MRKALQKSYSGVGSILGRYWRSYGGAQALLVSPYLHISLVLSLAMFPFWLSEPWWETALSTLPNVLGFTLAGFTIWLGFGDEKFRVRISKAKPDKASAFMGVGAAFAHFVVVQLLALIGALWAKAMDFPLPNELGLSALFRFFVHLGHFLGFALFVYALMSALAATLGVFRAASWYDRHKRDAANSSKVTDQGSDDQ